jgi:hypothetical protein
VIAGRAASDAGFTVVELLVAAAVTLTVAAGVFTLLNPAHGIFKVQPEVADLQQRLRVGTDALTKDLIMAGAGISAGGLAGTLLNHLAPVLPYRAGLTNSDAVAGRFYRTDAVTVLYVPPVAPQASIRDRLALNAQDLQLIASPNCPPGVPLCGFEEKMRVLLLDDGGGFDVATVMDLQNPVLRVQYGGTLSVPYDAGSTITRVVTHTYYLKTDVPNSTFQLMHYDGYQTDLPVVDNVVKLDFNYFGSAEPPSLLPGKSLDDALGPFTTYGPKPPPIDRDNPDDSWPAGENCVFAVQDGEHRPRLQVLAVGAGQVELGANMLTDGPWCMDARHINRFDADLLRIRRVRVTLRVQAAAASLRGPAGVLFTRAGTAKAGDLVPDQELSFDVTPRNMNLGR